MMNSAEKEAVLHCLKSIIDEEVCEECPLYGTTGTDHCGKDCVRLAINALSSSENPNKWIPVSERLPEDSELVLFSTKTDRVFEGRYFADNTNRQWYSFRDETFAWNNAITAWMPLPEPYKAEKGGNTWTN